MSKNRVRKCMEFLASHREEPWLSREGYRVLRAASGKLSQLERDTLSDTLELDLKWGSRDERWRQMMRLVMWLDILLCRDGTPARIVAQAALQKHAHTNNLTLLLQNRLDRYVIQENEKAIRRLADAATRVRQCYGADLDPSYAAAMTATFVSPMRPVCFRWFKCGMADAVWTDRISEGLVRYGYKTGGKTGKTEDAFTLPWPMPAPDVDLAAAKPPYNRCIEFPEPKKDVLVHEMLHWCTHDDFATAANAVNDANERNLVKEGTTEWLKRELTGLDDGGYKDLMPEYRKTLQTVDPGDIKKAYFRGTNVRTVIPAVIKAFQDEQARVSAQDRLKAARDRLKADFLARTKPSPHVATRSLNAVWDAFKDADAAELAKLPNGWGAWVTQKKGAAT